MEPVTRTTFYLGNPLLNVLVTDGTLDNLLTNYVAGVEEVVEDNIPVDERYPLAPLLTQFLVVVQDLLDGDVGFPFEFLGFSPVNVGLFLLLLFWSSLGDDNGRVVPDLLAFLKGTLKLVVLYPSTKG